MQEQTVSTSSGAVESSIQSKRLTFSRRFTSPNVHPFESVIWKKFDALIQDAKGNPVFEQKNVEAPEFWSQRAVNIVAEKYFRMVDGVKESSVKQLITRVANTIAVAGKEQGLFGDELHDDTFHLFEMELTFLLLHQRFAFNSPVWFNVGVPGVAQQSSACFINGVEDTMESITDLAKTEVMLFKGGSGAGSNMSNIRSSYETLSGGGSPSGPVSFMKMLDAGAGVTKSGGTTRRAALLRCLDVDHPDILVQANGEPGFISCKTNAEKIAQALIAAGFSAEFNKPGNAYDLSPFQNANNSVRVTDYFMRKVVDDQITTTKARTTGETVHKYKARMLWEEIAKAAWASGDPGLQFDTTMNNWNTIPNTDKIRSTNPCSEFVFVDDTSCNLGSFNLMKYLDSVTQEFQLDDFIHSTEICITAMEILCGYASYPTPTITIRTQATRPLGIGYANLGTMLMVKGLAYDSPEGREFAAGVTSLMTATAYRQSAKMAAVVGPFSAYAVNRPEMLDVIARHKGASELLPARHHATIRAANAQWLAAYEEGKAHGYRNAQVSVLAPTGTIGFMMDCDTTGCEPNLALTQFKKLVGGGYVKIPTRAVPQALEKLGYNGKSKDILETIEKTGELPADMKAEHKRVFQTALGNDQISTEGHLLMMAEIQQFLSGGISKTVNMPNSATIEDVANVYMRAWELGLKCVAIYRDGCKASQPVSAKEEKKAILKESGPKWGERRRLSDERQSITHKLSLGGTDAYLHVGLHDDGTPGELFVNIAKAGSTLHGLVDMCATSVSVGLQHGVPLATFIDKFKGMRFEPSGFTGNKEIPRADSLADYLAKWLEARFTWTEDKLEAVQKKTSELVEYFGNQHSPVEKKEGKGYHGDPCNSCGNLTVRAGSCYVCVSCGSTTGCG